MYADVCFSSLRCSGGGGVPRGGEGHGTTGGSGVRRWPDNPLCHHIFLTRPGHSVKRPLNKLKDRRRHKRSRWIEPIRDLKKALVVAAFVEAEEEAGMLWTFGAGCSTERGRESPPMSLFCYCHIHRSPFSAIQRELNAGRLSSCHRAAPGGDGTILSFWTESHVWGVSRVTSLLCANGLLWDIQMPLWPLTLEGFLLHLWRKDFFQKKKKQQPVTMIWRACDPLAIRMHF